MNPIVIFESSVVTRKSDETDYLKHIAQPRAAIHLSNCRDTGYLLLLTVFKDALP